ncbi:FtsX-like permease family protein [Scytonema sp. UIC 10036]|uniref:ABC transporter permease DevC n=1 Tax=Scytonema sp. UIC 10036 TaxID=2304196 RepID=UPI0012DAB9CF|nr:ABC transporter permease DevC [Scytonema sp. UIC 10036]MUG96300.1 FtsX-like permease family protein [Scytonema sp. UIC 10036]
MFGRWLRRTPLAWRQVMKEKTRLAIAVAGIAFADMLMFVQLGFQDALYDSATLPHRLLEADLVMTNPQFQTLFSVKTFSRERLYQALGHEAVKSVSSIYIGSGQWKNPENRLTRAILIWGIEPDAPSLKLPEIKQNATQVKLLNHVLFDRAGRPEYGDIASKLQRQGTLEAELNQQNIQVTGLFTVGSSFAADGNVITSDSTFLKLFPERQPNHIEVGLIQLKPGFDAAKVQAELAKELSGDVRILTPEGFASVEKYYWESQGTIGFIFGLGVVVGFIVGIIIVYQILYSDVADHLPEYATLKAMGYSDGYLMRVLLQEALLLAVLGFIPGFAIASALYQLTYAATLLPIAMTTSRAITVFVLTVGMCGFSGAVAMRKLQTADPADIF